MNKEPTEHASTDLKPDNYIAYNVRSTWNNAKDSYNREQHLIRMSHSIQQPQVMNLVSVSQQTQNCMIWHFLIFTLKLTYTHTQHTHTHTHTHTHSYTHTHIRTHSYTHSTYSHSPCSHAHTHTRTHMYMHTCMHTHAHSHTHSHRHSCIHRITCT